MRFKTRSALWCLSMTTVIVIALLAALNKLEGKISASGIRSVKRVRSQYRLYAGRPLPTEPPPSLSDEQSNRISHLTNTCNQSTTETLKTAAHRSLFVDDERKFIFCLIPGVAPSRWSRVLTYDSQRLKRARMSVRRLNSKLANSWRLDGLGPLLPLNRLLFTEDEIASRLSTYYKFVFVRHPIERLVATYIDRLSHLISKNGDGSLPEVVAAELNNRKGSVDNPNLAVDYSVQVTQEMNKKFNDFVKYIVRNSNNPTTNPMLVSTFWRPQSELCQPCAVRYDFVGHYETLYEDAYFVLEKIGMRGVRFPDTDVKTATSVTPRLISKMMSALSTGDLSRLSEFYRADLELFNFTLNNYVTI